MKTREDEFLVFAGSRVEVVDSFCETKTDTMVLVIITVYIFLFAETDARNEDWPFVLIFLLFLSSLLHDCVSVGAKQWQQQWKKKKKTEKKTSEGAERKAFYRAQGIRRVGGLL